MDVLKVFCPIPFFVGKSRDRPRAMEKLKDLRRVSKKKYLERERERERKLGYGRGC